MSLEEAQETLGYNLPNLKIVLWFHWNQSLSTSSDGGGMAKETFRKLLVRFGRMLSLDWPQPLAVYCEIFKVHMSLNNFKKKASETLTAKSGRKCSAREFKKEAVKRVNYLMQS